MTERLGFLSLGMVVAPLSFFYFYYLAWALKSGAVSTASLVEAVVLVTMIARLAVVMAVPRLRRGKASVIIDIFSVEVLVAAALVVLYIVLGIRTYPQILTDVALAWVPALLLVIPPFALYRLATGILEKSKLSTVIPFTVGLFSLVVVPAEVATLGSSVSGLSGVSKLLLSVFVGQVRYESILPEVTAAGLLVYVAMVLYVISREDIGQDKQAFLLVAVAGSLITLGWSALSSVLTPDIFLIFAVPGGSILAVVWWTTRGR